MKLIALSIIGPALSTIPFVLKVTDDCVDSLVGTSSSDVVSSSLFHSFFLFHVHLHDTISFHP